MQPRKLFNHPLSPLAKRTGLSFAAILIVIGVGMIGMKALSPGWTWIDSFYFMAMLGTAEGPPITPPTFWGEIFAGVMAFVSIGTLITAAGIIFGPALGYLFQRGRHFADEELHRADEELHRVERDNSKPSTNSA
jgi:hypothetical protein